MVDRRVNLTVDLSDGRLRGCASEAYPVESICRELPIAPSTYWPCRVQRAGLTVGRPAQGDDTLKTAITVCGTDTETCTAPKWSGGNCGGTGSPRALHGRAADAGHGLARAVRGGRLIVTPRPDDGAVPPGLG
jgi:hypothetical protein